MSAKEAIQEIATNPKTGQGVAFWTTGSGLGTVLEWIPNEIGKLATLVGILLSLTLIYANILRIRIERIEACRREERDKLELDILRNKLAKHESEN